MHRNTEDGHGFADLLRPYLDSLYRLAYRLTGTRQDAEDLLQDVLIKLYERRDELTSISDLGPWLKRVLYNRFVDDKRKLARKRLAVVDPDSIPPEISGLPCRCEGDRPDLKAEYEFSIKQLQVALGALSIDHRTVLLMHDAEGYKLEEIQTITGIPIGTLKSRLHRARARLRGLLESEGTF